MKRPRRRIPELLGLCLNLALRHSNSLSIPSTLWEYQLEASGTISSGSVRHGNGVIAAQDESSLWVTTDDGYLHLLTNLEPSNITEIVYKPLSLTDRQTESRSNAQLYEQDGHVVYGVYAILDVGDTISSRIIAVNSEGLQRWQVIIDGIAMGTPQIGVDGRRIYVTHNTGDDYLAGKLTMIEDNVFGVSISTEIPLQGAGGFGFADIQAPFGPASISTADGKDSVYWGESWNDGTASFGTLYKYSDGTVEGLRRTPWSTTVAPTLSRDGKSLWIEGGGSVFNGWTSGKSFAKSPSWSHDYSITTDGKRSASPRKSTYPLSVLLRPSELTFQSSPETQSKVVVSSSGKLVYNIVDSITIICLDAFSGNMIWTRQGTSPTLSSIKISDDDNFIIVVHVSQGLIQKFDALTGRLLAEHSCIVATGDITCRQRIEGSFSISIDGSKLWFADGFGKITRIEFGPDDISPTISPSMISVSTLVPTRTPIMGTSHFPILSKSLIPSVVSSVVPLPIPYPTLASSSKPTSTSPTIPSASKETPMALSPPNSSSPVLALSPAMSPFAPADSPNVVHEASSKPVSQPSFPSALPTLLKPQDKSADLLTFTGVNIDEILAETEYEKTQAPTSNVYISFSALLAISMLFLMISLATGVLIGRLWQLKRTRGLTLPFSINDDPHERYETRYLVGKPVQ